ncbi:MAG: CcmD family protein [Ferruginibacter sp.]
MTKYLGKLLAVLLVVFTSLAAHAQTPPGTVDVMRGSGKIYVVVAVCLTILLGLFLYVYSIDRKLSRLEKEK